ncbi:MAG: protein kinase [Coriobacteriia bacterium]|nr:protein kinase [Coriobacteriia bacterium]
MNKDDYLNKDIILDSVFRESEFERTEKILLVGKNGKKEGPFIRKIFKQNKGLGEIYKVLLNERNVGLNCDGIPNVYYAGREGDKLIIVEECFIGISLTDFLKKHNFDINLFNTIYLQICEAVDYLHTGFSKPIIHRGINPENILVNEDSHKIQLIDFGISQHFNEDEDQPTIKSGSRRAFKADVRNDIYSLGKVLEFMMDANN